MGLSAEWPWRNTLPHIPSTDWLFSAPALRRPHCDTCTSPGGCQAAAGLDLADVVVGEQALLSSKSPRPPA